jgi:protein gp37
MQLSPIEWTTFTANPLKFRAPDGRVVWACEKLSPGCTHCYAEFLSRRYGGTRRAGDWNAGTMATLTPFLDDAELHKMLTAKSIGGVAVAGSMCFVGDMTDVFGEWVSDELLDRLFAVFALRDDVTWQVLTKRADRMRRYVTALVAGERSAAREAYRLFDPDGRRLKVAYEKLDLVLAAPQPLPNVWLGVSAEDQQRADERIPLLLQTPAAVRFISAEPLLGPVTFRWAAWDDHSPNPRRSLPHYPSVERNGKTQAGHINELDGLRMLDWVIVGGESGNGARPCAEEWIEDVVAECQAAAVPVFVKQLGAYVVSEDRTAPADMMRNPADALRRFQAPNGEVWAWRAGLADRKGGDPSEWPADLRVREFPAVRP